MGVSFCAAKILDVPRLSASAYLMKTGHDLPFAPFSVYLSAIDSTTPWMLFSDIYRPFNGVLQILSAIARHRSLWVWPHAEYRRAFGRVRDDQLQSGRNGEARNGGSRGPQRNASNE